MNLGVLKNSTAYKLAQLLEKKVQLCYNVTCRVNDNTHF